mgnify:CR=1 FL=1
MNLLTSVWFWLALIIVLVIIRDIFLQKSHTISHNFPIVGHLRYWLETIGPELRQYIVANNREELPFNRQERSWIYASSKNENNLQGFGTDQDFSAPGYIFIKNAMIGYNPPTDHPFNKNPGVMPAAKIMGEYHHRRRPYRPYSIINISGMSFGSLSAKAIESLNKHPVALSITRYAMAQSASKSSIPNAARPTYAVSDFSVTPGAGAAGRVSILSQSPVVLIGSPAAVAHSSTEFHAEIKAAVERGQAAGLTVAVLAWDGVAIAVFAVGDQLKNDGTNCF